MIRATDIAWLAGIVEGEGCIGLTRRRSRYYPVISVEMTDKDVVKRVAVLLGCPVWYRDRSAEVGRRFGKKPLYIARTVGSKAAAWLMTLYPFLGERRREKAGSVLQLWRNSPIRVAA